jgi:pimeloyl-ACP methyl ester carboxylesterase
MTTDPPVVSRTALIEGSTLHYLTAGQGSPVVLLHGYTQTSRMWKPGIGDSDVPATGLDMKTAARRVHALARSLGVERASVVGHDIGLMVAYAYAAQFPAEVEKLVLMDAFLPGVPGWETAYNHPAFWHFRFNGPTPEALVAGRERIYFEYFWNDFAADKTRSLSAADREAYAAAYARPGRMGAGWAYFANWPHTTQDFAQLSRTRLTVPVLAIGGERPLGGLLGEQAKLIAPDVTVVLLRDT